MSVIAKRAGELRSGDLVLTLDRVNLQVTFAPVANCALVVAGTYELRYVSSDVHPTRLVGAETIFAVYAPERHTELPLSRY